MKKIFLASCFALLMIGSANAASTGWISADKFEREMRKLKKSKLIATSLSCKSGNEVRHSRKNTLFKADYRSNSKNLVWVWNWGDQVASIQRLNRELKLGYRMVSSNSFRLASGLRIKCALWHKKKSPTRNPNDVIKLMYD